MSNQSSPKNGIEQRKKLSKGDTPFYEAPLGVALSSQIIKEAREKLHDAKKNIKPITDASRGVRTLGSNRPFTPREEKRSLFGPKSTRPVNERPPSSFSIGSKSFDADTSSRPLSATRLSPIDKSSNPKLSSGSLVSLQSENLMSNEGEQTTIFRLNSPNIKSRLAPLEVSIDKKLLQKKDIKPPTNTPMTTNTNNNSFDTASSSNIESSRSVASNTQDDKELQSNWENYIQPVLNAMEAYFKESSVDKFCETCDRLNKQLEAFQMLSKTCPKRATILKIIFKYLDTDSDRIKIRVSKIILNMKVTSNNLTNICRLLFLISRNADNDIYFMENDIIDTLINSAKKLDFRDNSDTVVYFCGTIKNLSENQKLLKLLASKNIEETLVKIIKELSKYYKDNETLKSEAGHALVQIAPTLRNLADISNTRLKFLNLNLIEHLVSVLKYYTSDDELMLHISRILSKLTLHADCCQELVQNQSCYKSFIKVMIKHDSKEDLIVRIGFILGNLTAKHDSSRIAYINEKYSIDTLISILKTYLNSDLEKIRRESNKVRISNQLEDINENEPNPNEDVMIKFIRVIANLAINENAGEQLANRQDLLDTILKILETKDLTCEELVMDSIVTINNISFYNTDLIKEYSKKIVDCLMKYLLSENVDAILEVFRVFANLSREAPLRNYLASRKVNILAIAYLSSNNRELVYIVIGLLINITRDIEFKYSFKEEKGVKKLIEILTEIGPCDWQLSSMICAVLMNYSEKPKTALSFKYFESDECKLLRVILTELLDEKFALRDENDSKSMNENDDENINAYMNTLWREDFSPVASELLKRIEECKSD